jgi:ABC-type Fe3+/spermidine/putrescine transport system ATPase subunit
MIAGFESTSAGEIYIDGQPMSAVPPYLRPVNMVFQNYAIFPHLNVRDNIAYGLRRLGLPRAKQDAMVDEMLDLVAARLRQAARERAFRRAAAARGAGPGADPAPKVLLLDEPLGALDKQLREQMQLELRRLQRSVGITFVFVTHDQEEALTLSDRIAVMAGGKILQLDSPNRLYEEPRTREVAAFIGNMNFWMPVWRRAKRVACGSRWKVWAFAIWRKAASPRRSVPVSALRSGRKNWWHMRPNRLMAPPCRAASRQQPIWANAATCMSGSRAGLRCLPCPRRTQPCSAMPGHMRASRSG